MTQRVWAIGDLHLGFSTGKWMDRFGDQWKAHHEKIERNWREKIAPEDLVLLPGDFSWALRLNEVEVDFRWLAALPGKKVLIKGNHDYWWPRSQKKLRSVLPPGVWALKKTAVVLDGWPIVGVRGADFHVPGEADAAKVRTNIDRELREFTLSLEDLDRLDGAGRPPLAMFHYPPFPPHERESDFTSLIRSAGCEIVVYGHLHSREDWDRFFQGEAGGVSYRLVSCDFLDFSPALIAEG